MKVLAFGDLHLDVPFAWAPEAVAKARRANRRRTLENIVRLAQAEGVDALVCAGDLFEHERITPDTLEFLRATLSHSGLRTFLAPGNHDWLDHDSPYLQVEWGENVTLFKTDRLEPVELDSSVTLWGAAHLVPANTDDFFANFHVNRSGINLVVAHASESSALPMQGTKKVPHAPFDAAELATAGIDFAMLGHYHFPSEGPRFAYAGNPDPLDFGESGDRGALLVTVRGDGGVMFQRRMVGVSQVYDVVLSLNGERSRDEVADKIKSAVQPLRGCVRVTLSGEVEPSVELDLRELRLAAPHLDALVVRAERLGITYPMAEIARETTVRGQFVRDALANLTDADVQRRVILTGLRAFDGRHDLEVT